MKTEIDLGEHIMEKFYIVTNEKFLNEIEEFKRNIKAQRAFIREFFEQKGIHGTGYYMHGTGFINVAFDERRKRLIGLYIDNCKENNELFGNQLKKERTFSDGYVLREFKKNSAVLKEFQDLCVKKQIIVNIHWHREGDYFKETKFGGYSVCRFEYEGNYYLQIETDRCDSITPINGGFIEIKGSEFYAAKERYQEQVSGAEN